MTHWKDSDAREDLRQKKKRSAEDEAVRWHHQLNGYESEQSPGDSEGQGGLVVAVHGIARTESDMTSWLNKQLIQFAVKHCKVTII